MQDVPHGAFRYESLTLGDGRCVSYSWFGPGAGQPVLYVHGSPANRLNWLLHFDPAVLDELGVRVLAVDRSGLGYSSPHPRPSLASWIEDVREIADRLELASFALFGYSAGAPFAFACADALAERVTRTAVVSGSGDLHDPALASFAAQANAKFLAMGRSQPRLSRETLRLMGLGVRLAPGRLLAQAAGAMPPVDREVLAEPGVAEAFVTMLRDTLRQGPAGAQRDAALVASPWPFDLTRIRGEVRLWHGAEDANVPPLVAEHHARLLPRATLTVRSGEGHLSLSRRHLREILVDLLAAH